MRPSDNHPRVAELRACAAAFAFMTRIPVPHGAHDAGDLPRAAAYFPLVGLVVGLGGAAVFTGCALLWPVPLAVILSVAATVWMTGAFHEDALADACDGFGGGWDVTQVLTIMKDSRVGSYAVVGLVLVLAAKIAALATIAARDVGRGAAVLAMTRALVTAHVMGRWSSVALLYHYPYVRLATDHARPGTGRPFAGTVTPARLAGASLFTVVVLAAALGTTALTVGGAACIATWLAGRYFDRRIGGITGDTLGAANQLVELTVYLAIAARSVR